MTSSSQTLRVDINLLPDCYRQRRLQRRQAILVLALLVAVALLYPVYGMTSTAMSQNSSLRSQIEVLNQQIAMRQEASATHNAMVGLTLEYEIIGNKHGVLTEDFQAVVLATQQVEGEVPIVVTSITHEGRGGNLLISCYAVPPPAGAFRYEAYRGAFASYQEALLETGRFKSVQYSPFNFSPRQTVSYELAAQ